MKNLVLVILVTLTSFVYSQTSEEMSMISEINKIRKDPKSYIPVVEEYIKTQEKTIEFMSKSNVKVSVKSTEVKLDKNNDFIPTGKTSNGVSVYKERITTAKELIKELETMSPLDTLVFDSTMYVITKGHGEYLTSVNKIGHYDKNGDGCSVRFKGVGPVSENVANSGSNPLLVLMIDYGVSNKGHRKNLLNPDIKYVSVFINEHCVVQNFRK